YVKKAEEELEYLTGDEETRRLAYLREKAIRDEMAAMSKARKEGKAEGKEEGREEGKEEQKNIIAKKMLAKKMDINLIMEITGLTKEEIESL
ncbi:MAG: hypothetical protein J6A89_02115, partial [Clostridia bacterium]|nr:hypothetical protein [Clostridia bacterium]